MPIPENQLEIWAHQGSVTQSSATYATIRGALQSPQAAYANHDFNIFLQGSYGNDTNIWADSDVDIVIQLKSAFYYEDHELPEALRNERRRGIGTAAYAFPSFKRDVLARLVALYGADVHAGSKAITIAGTHGRREADVLPAVTFRRFFLPAGATQPSYLEGLCFFSADGKKIVNYPKTHSENCTSKHQVTNGWFKPVVRIFKNMRNRCVANGNLATGAAPSYFIEGMLYNLPIGQFGPTYGQTVFNALTWLRGCDRSALVCASSRHYLLRDNSPVSWSPIQFQAYLNATIGLWNGWGS